MRTETRLALAGILVVTWSTGCAGAGSAPAPGAAGAARDAAGTDYAALCRAIAADIEALRDEFPQLADFDADKAIVKESCTIGYTYKCHPATHVGGWTAAAPNPDPDGLWFHLGIWDEQDPEEAGAQVNTQPAIPPWRIGARRVTFLILEGDETRSVAAEIFEILTRHGLVEEGW